MDSGVNYCGTAKTSHRGFCLSTLENLMKYWRGGSYLVMKIISRITGGRPLLAIGYKYSYMNVLGFIDTEGAESNEPGDHYLSRLPEIYSNFSVRPVVLHRLLGIYFNACTTIDNPNRMQ